MLDSVFPRRFFNSALEGGGGHELLIILKEIERSRKSLFEYRKNATRARRIFILTRAGAGADIERHLSKMKPSKILNVTCLR